MDLIIKFIIVDFRLVIKLQFIFIRFVVIIVVVIMYYLKRMVITFILVKI